MMKPKNFFESLNCAIQGVIHALVTQRNLKIHILFTIIVLLSAVILNFSITDFAIICILVVLVIAGELFNTALEWLTDMMKKDFHITVKYIKDISAGAVLFNALIAFFAGLLIFSKYAINDKNGFLRESVFALGSISLLLVTIIVISLKALLISGKPLHGGMPSGHAAISFSLFVSFFMWTKNMYVLLPLFLIAVLISFSRLYMRIHKKNEVLVGALLGGIITYTVFLLKK